MINIIFLGAPGSGKGTQAALLAKDLNLVSISTGEVLRKEISDDSSIGKLVKGYVDSGHLVPDRVVIDVIKNRISLPNCNNGFILDGFPRNLSQGESLDKMLSEIGKKIDLVLNIEVSIDVIIKRISGRFSCKDCGAVYNHFFDIPKKSGVCNICGGINFESRNDDTEEVIANRLKIYSDNAMELIAFYKRNSLIYSVDGLKKVPLVADEIKKIVNLVSKNLIFK